MRLNPRRYLVKWRGYDERESTWEPIENLSHAQEKLKDFHDNLGLLCHECGYCASSRKGLKTHREERKH